VAELRTPLAPTPQLPTSQPSPLGVRPPGLGTGLGDILQSMRQPSEPYEAPLWSRQLTLPAYSSIGASERQPSRTTEFPIRFQAPNIFGEGQAPPPQQDGFTSLLESELGQTALTGLGALPGKRELFHGDIATAPITIANFPTYGREGLLALLSTLFLEGGYQQTEGGTFGQDVEYSGPKNINAPQNILKGIIEGNKAVGDILWGVFDGISAYNRETNAKYRGHQLRSVLATGSASRPVLPIQFGTNMEIMGSGWLDNIFTSLGLTGTSAKYSYDELSAAAKVNGLNVAQMAAEFYDFPIEVVTEIMRDPNMSDEKLFELVQHQPYSQDALASMLVEGGFQIALIAGTGIGATRAMGLLGKVGTGGVSAFGTAARGGTFAGGRLGGRIAASSAREAFGSSAGFLTRKALQLNAWNTAAGWSIRGFEWGLKQYGGIVGDEGLVKLADRLLWEMPLSMNPGLNLIDGFTMHPLRHIRQLRGADGGGRRIVIGDEGSFSDAGTINLSRRRFELPRGPDNRIDVASIAAVRVAADDIRVRVAGREEVLPKGHPLARLVEVVDGLTLDDIHEGLLKNLGWERAWVTEAFESGKYGLTVDDLKNFLIYAYAQTVRERGFAPHPVGATMRERSREFFRLEAPEILEAFFTDLDGKTGHFAQSIKGQWWNLKEVNDSYMAGLKRRDVPYDPYVAFQSMRHWIAASKRLHEAYLSNAAIGDMVVTYARRLNRAYIQDTRDHILMHYDKGAKISQQDVLLLRHNAGPVEQVVPALQKGKKVWERDEFIRMLDKLDAEAARDVRPTRRLDPNLREGWQPGDDFAADARVLGIEPIHARAIENAMEIQARTGEPPPSAVPQGILVRVAKDLSVHVDTLKADPKAAWARVFAWYDDKLNTMHDAIRTRDKLVALRRDVDAAAASGRLDRARAEHIGEAIERINSEIVNRPVPRPINAKGPPPDGVVWASDDGMARWTQATRRAQALENDIQSYLEDPLGKLRIVGEETADPNAIGQFAVRAADTGRMEDLLALLRLYKRGDVTPADDAARALLDDPNVHPYRKMNALADALWPATMDTRLRAVKDGLAGTDEDALMRELVGEVTEVTPDTNIVAQVDGLTAQVAGHTARRQSLLEEVLGVSRDYDAVEGVLTPETRMLIDRRMGAKVEPSRRIVSQEALAADDSARDATRRIASREQLLKELDAEEAALAARLAETEVSPYTPPEAPPAPSATADDVIEGT
jgi:hypothetical protein